MRRKRAATAVHLWAVCCLGVSAISLPGELFGRPAGNVIKHRTPPPLSAICFFDASGRVLAPDSDSTATVTAFEWRVGPIKTDMTGQDSTRLVAAAYAVQAL
jgi:hypothetical protein